MAKIAIQLPTDRMSLGTLTLLDSAGNVIAGPFAVFGMSCLT